MSPDALPNGSAEPRQEPTDEALVAMVAKRDVAAFALLYDRHAAVVYSLAARSLGEVKAEEVVQDVFLRLWASAGQYDARRGAFCSWFFAILRHQVLAEQRRQGQEARFRMAGEVDALLADAVDAGIDLEEQVWLRDRGAAVLRALRNLPLEQRRVLVLAYFGGLSQSTLAGHLGWPLGTVKKRIRLGLQKLRVFLEDEDPRPADPATPPRIVVE
jgi:RNA polymerase sigma-70 factor (ECF subfamily)